jgi:hypothetical protein
MLAFSAAGERVVARGWLESSVLVSNQGGSYRLLSYNQEPITKWHTTRSAFFGFVVVPTELDTRRMPEPAKAQEEKLKRGRLPAHGE